MYAFITLQCLKLLQILLIVFFYYGLVYMFFYAFIRLDQMLSTFFMKLGLQHDLQTMLVKQKVNLSPCFIGVMFRLILIGYCCTVTFFHNHTHALRLPTLKQSLFFYL